MSIAVYSAQQTQQLFDLFSAMTDYYAGDPARINHFVKVHAYARQIGLAEQLDADTLFLLEADFLVNMIEEGMKADTIQCGREKIFRTGMGLRLMERLTEKKCNS